MWINCLCVCVCCVREEDRERQRYGFTCAITGEEVLIALAKINQAFNHCAFSLSYRWLQLYKCSTAQWSDAPWDILSKKDEKHQRKKNWVWANKCSVTLKLCVFKVCSLCSAKYTFSFLLSCSSSYPGIQSLQIVDISILCSKTWQAICTYVDEMSGTV